MVINKIAFILRGKMKKVGILTFNRAINYGAVLQAFALKNALNKYRDTEIINYKNEKMENVYSLSSKNVIKTILKRIQFSKKNKRFYQFIDENATEKSMTRIILIRLKKALTKSSLEAIKYGILLVPETIRHIF